MSTILVSYSDVVSLKCPDTEVGHARLFIESQAVQQYQQVVIDYSAEVVCGCEIACCNLYMGRKQQQQQIN